MQWTGWSLKLGRFAGIDLFMHATFPLLFVWIGLVYWLQTGTIWGVLFGLSFIAVLFFCVVLHEYGHALTARRYGIGTRFITLLPIGGLAALERMPKDPRQEIVVALMGPAVNIAIAFVLFVILGLSGGGAAEDFEMAAPALMPSNFLQSVLFANIFLAVFNMIPAFPMDGGRVLRAALSFRMGRLRATQMAARIGQGLALLFGLAGLFGNPFLVLIAVFIWIGAIAEAGGAEIEMRLHHKPVSRAMITDFQTLNRGALLSKAVDLTLAGTLKDFPVLDGNRVVGVASQKAILRGLRDYGLDGTIDAIMSDAVTAAPDADLAELMEALQQDEDVQVICILENGDLVGLINLDNISEYLRIQAALSDR
ncbi:site-2 protease family protein [Roseinatronobacter bogoriensis]|uniref:Zinc metalloprotease n=1 Tax=Roseinatronobacter bogoriensis subsp. barguzinensis TaxID=441209 RepID=A0A2K8K4S8_9RHOB|nr:MULTISPECIES: site-2 protease family protein [Rhodobaca]ATX64457.1 site-2 protease family protein [Rhodobaca barguzinensis]MBB4209162.1 Zn-dependent protease/CBS domain-containing protein [Rhodobaca bogoriensis DSM 18756]TDW36310.1 Zn-dependent protease [Rhodobaca barguzinensis]TDY67562.1 Zn-dependent protease [Rhodobaca bogoriensis DSM 18756]